MTEPRFLFVARAWSNPGIWSARKPLVAGIDPVAYTAGPWVAWRLVGANNRELGRSGRTFRDLTDCVKAVAEMRSQLGNCQCVVYADPSTGSWHWKLDIDGVSLAVSGRAYQRQRECAYSCAQFQAAVPTAAVMLRSLVDVARDDHSADDDARPRRAVRMPAPRGSAETIHRSADLSDSGSTLR